QVQAVLPGADGGCAALVLDGPRDRDRLLRGRRPGRDERCRDEIGAGGSSADGPRGDRDQACDEPETPCGGRVKTSRRWGSPLCRHGEVLFSLPGCLCLLDSLAFERARPPRVLLSRRWLPCARGRPVAFATKCSGVARC